MTEAEKLSGGSALARLGHRVFGWRLLVGLLALIPAAIFIRPQPWGELSIGLRISAFTGIIIGLLLRAWAAACAGDHTRSGVIEASQLATNGPYSRVRNPIYVGNFILGLGMIALLGDAWLLPLHLLTFIVLYAAIIPAEEQFLTRTFGEVYSEYCRNVPRLRPRLTSWRGGRAIAPDWKRVRGELRIAVLLAAIYALLVVIGTRDW